MNKTPMIRNVITASALLIGIAAFATAMIRPAAKLAWVDLPTVYKEFDYKKEMETKLIRIQEARKNILDSLELELRMMSEDLKTGGKSDTKKMQLYQLKGQEYMNRKKLFDEDNYMNKAKYEEQVLTQLNQYVKDYGAEEGYDFIYGADGTGAVMYAEKGIDITEEVKKYVNEKYKGSK